MSGKLGTVALALWWCEGTKPRKDNRWKNSYLYPVEIINSDQRIIAIFLKYLRKNFKINEGRLKGQIQIHEGDYQDKIEKYWAKVTKIPRKQFNKTIVRPKGNKPGKAKYGTFKLRYYDKPTYLKLQSKLDKEIIGVI